jgi:hypothetical protein
MRDAGMQVLPLIARPGEPLEPIFENLTGKRVDALLIQGSIARKEMLDLAIARQMDGGARSPAVATWWRVGLKRRWQFDTK